MKAAAFDLLLATDAKQALAHLREPGAKPIAGGQSLGPMLNLRLARPPVLVELSRSRELRRASEEAGAVRYGAAVTHAEIEDGAVPDATPGWLATVAAGIAYRAVRNRGTIGGSLAHADPAADWLVTLSALGAELLLLGARGERTVEMPAFVTGPFATALGPDEIVLGVRVPRPPPGSRWGYWKFTRKLGEFAKASAAVLLRPEQSARIAVGALEQAPLLLPEAEAVVAAPDIADDALRRLLPARDPASLELHAIAIRRALAIAAGA